MYFKIFPMDKISGPSGFSVEFYQILVEEILVILWITEETAFLN